MTEHQISILMHDSTADLAPDVASLIEGGVARGQGRRRRRRIGTTLGAVVVIGVIAAGAAIAPTLPGGAPDAAPRESQVANDPEPTPSADEPSRTPQPERRSLAVKAAQIPGVFTEVFPGAVEEAVDEANGTGGYLDQGPKAQIAHFRWNGYLMTVGLTSGGISVADACRNLEDGYFCNERQDGTTLLSWTDTGPAVDGGVAGRGVSLFTTDGWEVFAISYNAADAKDSPVLAEEPPFTLDQLEQVATSNAWFR
ncbi:MAG: hypothetical protein WKF79_09640 [Nocardioides sp.]